MKASRWRRIGRTILPIAALVAGAIAPAAQGQIQYEYDSLGRLKSATDLGAGYQQSFDYDAAGNRTAAAIADGIAGLSIDSVSVTEGGAAVFTVTRTGDTDVAHSVDYATADGSATAGSDYTAKSGALNFATGETAKTISVSTTNDSVHEASETFFVNLSNPGVGVILAAAQGVATIADNDPPPSFSISNASVTEGGTLSFTVTKTGSTALSHKVSYATANGTANSADYTSKSGTLTFSASQTSKTVSVSTTSDDVYETNQTVLVNLSNPTNGATISNGQGTGTIVNDDAPPSFKINNVTARAGNTLTFKVTKTGATERTHKVNYATANGTASAGTHYASKSGQLSFSASSTSKNVTVSTVAGSVPTGSKTMKVNLSSPTNGATIADSQGIGTITAPPAPVAVNDTVHGNFPRYSSVHVYVRNNDYDPGGYPFTVTSASCVSSGCSVSVVGGNYLSILGSSIGVKTVNYTITNNQGGVDTATVTVSSFQDVPDCGDVYC